MSFKVGTDTITLKGDPTLTKAEVSLKAISKSWSEQDQGYLVELQKLTVEDEEKVMIEEEIGEEELIPTAIQDMIENYASLFELPTQLPPRKTVDHQITLLEGQPQSTSGLISMLTYRRKKSNN